MAWRKLDDMRATPDRFDEIASELMPDCERCPEDSLCTHCLDTGEVQGDRDEIAAALRRVAAEENERCARIVEKSYRLLTTQEFDTQTAADARMQCAALIRAARPRGGLKTK